MERNIKIERYKPGREKEVLKLLQGSGRRFQLADIPVAAGEIKQEDFEKFVLGHKDFKPEDVFLAISKDELLGIMCIRKEENKGLVPVLVIKNHYLERVGPFLLRKAEESLLQVDRVIIGVGVGLIPLISWIREKEERNLVQFLLSQGYRKSHDIRLHMALEVKNFKTPDNLEKLEEQCNRKGIHFRPCLNENELENVFQKFDLRRGYVEELRIQKRLDLIHLAFLKNRIIGYCSYLGRSLGRNELVFGPIEVAEELRGKGIGTVLLVKSLQDVIKKESAPRIVLSTHRERVRFYSQVGFEIISKHTLMEKSFMTIETRKQWKFIKKSLWP